MTLAQQVRDAFAPQGALSRAADHFQPREAQTEMALAVAGVMEQGGVLVVEAGTGVGKTFAYLVPALLSGEPVLLSTATKTLQDQLFGRDLPRLVQALGVPARIALLKGRGSYLCLHRMEQARQELSPSDPGALRTLARVESWALHTRSGDLAELPELDERSPVIPLVTSTRENCLGTSCPRFRACHVNLARREALVADVVVVNHHLFFADLAVRESGMAELLPTARVTIFDEAHQINETGVQFLGLRLSTAQVLDLARDMLAVGLRLARGLADWHGAAAALEQAARDWRLAAGHAQSGSRLRWLDQVPEGLDADAWQAGLGAVEAACRQVAVALDTVSELGPDCVRLQERASGLADQLRRFAQPCAPESVRWVELGRALQVVESPLDIAQAVQTRLLRGADEASGEMPNAKAFVFTSATLGDDAGLSWFTEACGLSQARILKVGSPFDYGQQAALYVPRQLVRPGDPSHSRQVAALAADAARRLGGRTLVLTTTLRALRAVGEDLAAQFAGTGELEVLVQGQQPKRRLMARFREGADPGVAPGCVLVASASFWEGVDVPGDALQLVIIDKLPFPPPGDPLVEARSRRLELAGRSPFRDYALPEAAVALKQGAGRLIRRESDRGILVVCDTRLVTMGYGRRLLAALPAMRRLDTEGDFQAALAALTRVSTMDPDSV
jgi:ATP-dependent DNA helicase DinG